MKTNEHDYYSNLANWSFDDIDYFTERNEGIKETPVLAMGYTSIGESRKQYWCNPTAVLPWGCDYIGIRNYILRERPAWPDRNP